MGSPAVGFRHPFTCDVTYLNGSRSRLLYDLFQAHGVDVVFSGHSHMSEHIHPMTFEVKPGLTALWSAPVAKSKRDS